MKALSGLLSNAGSSWTARKGECAMAQFMSGPEAAELIQDGDTIAMLSQPPVPRANRRRRPKSPSQKEKP